MHECGNVMFVTSKKKKKKKIVLTNLHPCTSHHFLTGLLTQERKFVCWGKGARIPSFFHYPHLFCQLMPPNIHLTIKKAIYQQLPNFTCPSLLVHSAFSLTQSRKEAATAKYFFSPDTDILT